MREEEGEKKNGGMSWITVTVPVCCARLPRRENRKEAEKSEREEMQMKQKVKIIEERGGERTQHSCMSWATVTGIVPVCFARLPRLAASASAP